MADLSSLFAALQTTQQAKTKVRLSDRNVIELVNRLKALGLLGEDLLYTINGKEYITTARLKEEIGAALRQAGGRLSLVELPALLGVDLVHCERQAAALVAESNGSVLEAQGELITTQYFDTIASEINELLQEAGQLNVADLALQYTLSTELLIGVITSHLDSVIKGRLEGVLLYTPAYMRNIRAQLRGALRAHMSPVAIPSILKDFIMDGGTFSNTGSIISQLAEELIQGGQVVGALKGGSLTWVPAIYASAQQSALTSFYEQNGWIGYDTARSMGLSGDRSSLQQLLPQALPLDTCLVAPVLLAQCEAAVEDALSSGGWVDVAPLLPSIMTPADVTAILTRLPQLSAATGGAGAAGKGGAGSKGSGGAAAAGGKGKGKGEGEGQGKGSAGDMSAGDGGGSGGSAVVVAGSVVVSPGLVQQLRQEAEAVAREAASTAVAERKAGPKAAGAQEAGAAAAQKRGAAGDSDDEDWSSGKKGKAGAKGGAKGGKGAGAGSKQSGKAAAAGGAAPGGASGGAAASCGLTASRLADLVLSRHPDLAEAGDGSGAAAESLAEEVLLPAAVVAFEQALQAALTAGAEERRRAKDALAKALDESFQRLCLYSRGIEEFASPTATAGKGAPADSAAEKGSKKGDKAGAKAEGVAAAGEDNDPDSTYSTLTRHVLRTTAAECSDLLHKWVTVDAAASAGTPPAASDATAGPPLTAAERTALVRSVASDVGAALNQAAAAASAASTKDAESALESAADTVGIRLRRPDKKSEKAALAALRSRLLAALSTEQDPAAALALVVPLLFIKATGKAISLPGKAIGAVLARVRGDIPADSVAKVEEFHSLVVQYLKAAAGESGQDSTVVARHLEAATAKLPGVKALVGLGVAGEEQAGQQQVEGDTEEQA